MPESINALPDVILIKFTKTYELLDQMANDKELPIIDSEAIMSILIDVFFKPLSDTNRVLVDTVDKIVDEVILSGVKDNDILMNFFRVKENLISAALACFMELCQFKLYVENRLLYEYDKRRDKSTAVLIRRKNGSV